MGDTDRQYNGRLIEEYQRLMLIRKYAVEENATKTLQIIDREINYIKLKLQPIELPDD